MSTHCPDCGSPVSAEADVCPVCGESLAETPDQEPTTEPAAEPVEATAADDTSSEKKPDLVCPECGARNPVGTAECRACGAELSGVGARSSTPSPKPPPRKTTPLRDYLTAATAIVVLAGIVYLVAAPRPPQASPAQAAQQPGQPGQQSAGDLPSGHPPLGPTEQQMQQLDALKAQMEANPDNPQLKLDMANALYNVNMHEQAIDYYEQYLQAHPDDPDARTDLAFSIFNTGNIDRSIAELMRIVREHPGHQPSRFNLAVMYTKRDNADSVLYWLREVVKIDSTSREGIAAMHAVQELEARTQAK